MSNFEIQKNVLEALVISEEGLGCEKILFGMVPSTPFHLGHDKLLVELKAIEHQAGAHVTVFLADIHSRFKGNKSLQEMDGRVEYYKSFIRMVLGDQVGIVLGSEVQFRPDYVEMLYESVGYIDIKKLRNEAPKSMKNTSERDNLSLIYLVMQCLDPIYLNVDAVFAEHSQKKIYDIGLLLLPYMDKLPAVVYTDSVHDISGNYIQQSTSETRIGIHDSSEVIGAKVRKMFAPPAGQVLPEGRVNALLECFEWSVFPFAATAVKIKSSKTNAFLAFESFGEFQDAFANDWLHPMDCKAALAEFLTRRCCHLDASMSEGSKLWIRRAP